ncbi:hypothetical protein [Sphaerospermopsis sp. LEGE 08334]|jgi:hypothetical protein|uniref:hypothetical protein n=1 Tax=Sphaerospermopsis sp. LEGE 08334 TaxID=1828651 RepID=UPI00187E272A|nr:hypothetical protein [Sphaerospermopsis sp. LEGE 08334]MBE9058082.1 hypothetical protein [Sphaerospermopsis sp. LEGE 08334]
MNRLFKSFQRLILRLLVISFVVFAFFGFQAFSSSNAMLLAQADTVITPEGTYYKGTPDQEAIRNEQPLENTQRQLQETADNIREKLNLDEPIPESTRQFLEDVRTNIDKSLEPITGDKPGYYQENIPPERILRDKR